MLPALIRTATVRAAHAGSASVCITVARACSLCSGATASSRSSTTSSHGSASAFAWRSARVPGTQSDVSRERIRTSSAIRLAQRCTDAPSYGRHDARADEG